MPGTITVNPMTTSDTAAKAELKEDGSNAPSPPLAAATATPVANAKDAAMSHQHQLKRFIDDEGHFSLVRNFHLADLVTLMNGFCGSFALFFAGRYLVWGEPAHMWVALFMPNFGCLFDLFDGKIARWRKSSSMLGQELDSLADSLSFGVAPAFLAFTMGLRTSLDTLILTIFICSGIARLARFNATVASIPTDDSGKAKYFEGLPIPSTLVLGTLMQACFYAGLHEATPDGKGLPGGVISFSFDWLKALLGASVERWDGRLDVHVASFLFAAWGAMMVSKTLKVPKP